MDMSEVMVLRSSAMSRPGRFGPDPGDWRPDVPAGIFLDTVIVAYLENFAEVIFEGAPIDPAVPQQQARQLEALRLLMAIAGRAGFAFAVSDEVARQAGGHYVRDIAEHWEAARVALGIEERGLAPVTLVAELPKRDRLILAQAYRSGCEVVLTNDLQWVRQLHRTKIASLGMEAHTPESLIERLEPWLGLWV